ncbi:MAG: hypothetical protein AAGA56_29015, partial [Myxococcota bacterium]
MGHPDPQCRLKLLLVLVVPTDNDLGLPSPGQIDALEACAGLTLDLEPDPVWATPAVAPSPPRRAVIHVAAPAVDAAPRPPNREGYELLELIGSGGMGRVYRGVQQSTGDPVAVKLPRTEHRTLARTSRLMVQEAAAAARLRHPCIVGLLRSRFDEVGTSSFAQEVMVRAALLGRVFEEPVLLDSLGTDARRDSARSLLDRALLAGLVVIDRGGETYRFEHDLVHQELLRPLPSGPDHRALAREMANALETGFARTRIDIGARTGHLHRMAGNVDDAYRAIGEAVQRLGRWGSIQRQRELADTLEQWLLEDGEQAQPGHRIETVLAVATWDYNQLAFDTALERLHAIERDVERDEDLSRRARVRLIEALSYFYAGRYGSAEARGRRLLEALNDASNPATTATEHHRARHLVIELLALRGGGAEPVRLATDHYRASVTHHAQWAADMAWGVLLEQLLLADEFGKAQALVKDRG